jgi:hypothetical protein
MSDPITGPVLDAPGPLAKEPVGIFASIAALPPLVLAAMVALGVPLTVEQVAALLPLIAGLVALAGAIARHFTYSADTVARREARRDI